MTKKIHVWYAMGARCEISTISGQEFQTGNKELHQLSAYGQNGNILSA
jgi:hypothetical protein